MKNIHHLASALLLVQQGEKLPLSDFTHQLCELQKVFKEPGITDFFRSVVPLKVKKQILSQSLTALSLYPVLLRFLYVLLETNHLHYFSDIVKSFLNQSEALNPRMVVRLKAFCPLSSGEKKTLQYTLKQTFHKEVHLKESVHPHTLGGLRMEMAGLVWDHTLQCHLKQMETQIRSRLYGNTGS